MNDTGRAQFSIKWDIRTGSPRKLWRALHDFLDDNGFAHEYEELILHESPIEGTATFGDWLHGQREYRERASLWFLRIVFGLLLCLTIVLIPAGLALIRSNWKTIRTRIRIGVEGEVYRTRGASMNASRAEEFYDVVADTRIIMEVEMNTLLKKAEDEEEERIVESQGDIESLRQDFKELAEGLDILLPTVALTVPRQQINEAPE